MINTKGFAHILILIAIVIVGAILILGKDKIKLPVTFGSPVPSATPDPTVGWKTYTGKYFSFKYPPNYTVDMTYTPISVEGLILMSPSNENKKQLAPENGELKLDISVEKTDLKTVKDYVFPQVQEGLNLPPEFITLGGQETAYLPQTEDIHSFPIYVTIFNNNYQTTIVKFPKDNMSRKNELDQILASFKFIDQSNTTYSCPASGYVDCMPTIGEANPACSKEALGWYKANCPNLQGVAY